MSSSNSPSQWDSLLCNLGKWQGSFTRFSPSGLLLEDIPSLVTLQGLNENQTIRQTIQHFSAQTGEVVYDKVLEYSSLGRSILLFETGEFSQGSIQYAPFSEFGAELGFIQSDRRLRIVQLFDKNSHLSSFTLIREHRPDTPLAEPLVGPLAQPLVEQLPLTVDQLLGDWEGNAITLYPDWRSPAQYTTHLSIRREGDRLMQRLATAEMELASTAAIEGSLLRFEQGKHPVQVLLLPGGASVNTPITLPKGQAFFLEAGWLIADDLRQRMIRSYDAQGAWSSLTLITERRAA